jgi:predicted nucleotidyltransferase
MHFGEPFGGLIPGSRGAVLATLLRTGEPLTGRQVHRLVAGRCSLWSAQEALKALVKLGLVNSRTVGRANVYTINNEHIAIASLRALNDPAGALRSTIRTAAGPAVDSVLLFGSIARGESTPDSDIDLAVIAAPAWDQRVELQAAVRAGLGNDCDVLVFTPEEFEALAAAGEPVVAEILRDAIALIGTKPRVKRAAA